MVSKTRAFASLSAILLAGALLHTTPVPAADPAGSPEMAPDARPVADAGTGEAERIGARVIRSKMLDIKGLARRSAL